MRTLPWTSAPQALALALTLGVGLAGAQSPPPRIDLSGLGPQVGQAAPDFTLTDQTGRTWSRAQLMGPSGLMLVFSRSADWCPYCKTQMVELQGRLGEVKARGLGLAVITYDASAVLADFAKRRGIAYPLLSDPGSKTIRSYGILNTTVAADSPNYGIPHPGTYILDPKGVITSRHFEDAYQERTTAASLLLSTSPGRAPTKATRAVSSYLDVVTYASDEVVAPGTLFSLVFEVTPKRNVHVYAPGAKDYRPIAFTLDPNPLLITRPMQYPSPEIYHFKPLDERVPVFQKPFRLTQRVGFTAAADKRAAVEVLGTVTLTGALQYQACDDRVCFAPQSVPLSYTVRVRPLDLQRATPAPR
jgi:peroxiredoxin